MEPIPKTSSESAARRANGFVSGCDSPLATLEFCRASGQFTESDHALKILTEAVKLDEKLRAVLTLNSEKGLGLIGETEVIKGEVWCKKLEIFLNFFWKIKFENITKVTLF